MNTRLVKIKQDILIIVGCLFIGFVLIKLTSAYFNAFVFFMMVAVGIFLLAFSRRPTKASSVLFLVSIIILIVTLFEVAALLYYRIYTLNAADLPRYTFGRTQYWLEDKQLGYKPRPSTLVRAHKSINGNFIYDTEYSFTSDALRTTKSNKQSQCAFLFFGGARVFGEGLPDIQTLPYQFSRKLNYNYNVLNYAFHGYGPHQMLRLLETGNTELARGKAGVVFYLLAPDDLEKISGNIQRFQRGPKYIIDEGALEYAGGLTGIGGIFNSYYDFKHNATSLLKQSQLTSLIINVINNNNTNDLNRRYELLWAIIKQADELIREKYNSRFVIIIRGDEDIGNNLLNTLAKNNINYVNMSKLLSQDWDEHYLLQDGINFNDKVNNELAAGLANRHGDCK